MTKKELRKVSLQFRTLSSQMLKIDSEDEIIYIRAFYNYITETSFIHDYILSCGGREYDFDELFNALGHYERLNLPVDQKELINYGYQLITYILSEKRTLVSMGFFHYTSSNKYTDMISSFMRKAVEPFVVALRTYLELSLIDVDGDDVEESSSEKTIFLSYCQKDAEIADLIDKSLSERLGTKARISRDIRDVAYHESFGKFMRSIQDHDFVVLLISDHYLKSRNCMFEVKEAIKDNRFEKKILFIVLRDEDKQYIHNPCAEPLFADIYSPDGQAQYIKFWQDAEAELSSQIRRIGDPTCAIEQIKEQRIIKQILLDLPEFFAFIRDNNALPLSDHLSDNFTKMLNYMGLFE